MFPSTYIPIYTDASGVHSSNNYLQRGAGVYLVNTSKVCGAGEETWISKHGCSITLLESLAALEGLLSAISQYGRAAYTIFCDMQVPATLSGKGLLDASTVGQS